MKVYVVETHYDNSFSSIEGVYHSKQKAEDAAEKLETELSGIDGVSISEEQVL